VALAGARQRSLLRQLVCSFGVVLLVMVGATAFFVGVERWPLLDSVYMTVITLSTVGYGEVRPLDERGRLASMVLIVVGLTGMAFGLRCAAELVLREQLLGLWTRRKIMRELEHLRDHHIVCGYGRMGREVVQELVQRGLPVAVIERDPPAIQPLSDSPAIAIQGDATLDNILIQAGVQRAKAMVSVVSRDEDNLFITISARHLNPNLHIVVRCDREESREKLIRAGASRVVSPYVTGGRQIAAALTRPAVLEFVETLIGFEQGEAELEEVTLRAGSPLIGTSLGESAIHDETGASVVAVRGPDGHFHTSPPPDRKLRAGDTLIVMGTDEQLAKVEKLTAAV